MQHLTFDLNAILAQYDLAPFFIIVSGVIAFWILMAWILLFIINKMR
jgi:hypothetical protein